MSEYTKVLPITGEQVPAKQKNLFVLMSVAPETLATSLSLERTEP
jgi:hypothetical protein